MIAQILELLISIPKIADFTMKVISAIVSWYVEKQTKETLALISDAAAFAARATTAEERYAAAKKWQDALSRERFLK